MENNCNLNQLINSCKKDNRKAQKELFELYKNRMFALCLRYSKSNTEAEDMMIEGFTRIFQSISQYEASGSFEAWMKRVMINNAINIYKANLKHNKIERDIIERNNMEIFAPDYTFSEEEILSCVQRLPKSLKVIFNLSAIDQYSNKEISETLNMTTDSVKSNLYKARRCLREYLEELTNKVREN